MADGTVPNGIASFGELHDFVDANEYGGLCDDDCPADVWDAADDIQNALDAWLRERAA